MNKSSQKLRGIPQELASHFAELDKETLQRDQAERKRRLQQEEKVKAELAKALQSRTFGGTVGVIGLSFAILLAVLPPNPGKPVLYILASITVLIGVYVLDRAHKRVGQLLPLVSMDDLEGMD